VSVTQQIERVPPQNLEAEQGVLGSMLLDRDAIARTVEALRPEDFYRDAHRAIFSAMLDLFERGEPVDLITVTNRLASMGKLEDVGGATYLASLPNVVPTAANVDYYASIVLEKAMLRALINAGTHIAAMGYEGADDVEALIDHAERLVFGIASRRSAQDFEAIKEILKESFEKIDKRYQEKGTVTGIATGFTDFDMHTSGLQPSDMIIVAARPSVGKCLSYDSEILLEDGSIATIEEVYHRRQGRLLTLGADGTLRLTEPSAFVDDGVRPVFRVTTRLGRTVECTATHPFLTAHGWLPLAALRRGERVAVPRTVAVFGARPLRECEVKLLAERSASRKEIPSAAFTLPRPQLALFLSRLLATGGWASVRPESGRALVGYATVSQRLARHVQHLLLRFGIIAGLRRTIVARQGTRWEVWQLEIADPASLRAFAHEITIFGKEAQVREVLAAVEAGRRAPAVDPLLPAAHAARRDPPGDGPRAIAQVLPDVDRARPAGGDLYWDEIASIEPAGPRQVYDLTIPETHNFVANDICVHNTTFALNIAQHAALVHKVPVAIFSLETSKEQLVQRILCSEAQVDNTKLRTGFLADEDWRKLARAMGGLSEAPIFIDDSATLSVIEMRAKARKLKAEHGLGLIVIDYIQMIQSYKRAENRTQELSEIARGIKSLAKELSVPVITISQLSRAVEALGQKRPMLSHLRECVAGDTTVWDADSGRRHTVADLAGMAHWPRLLSLGRTGTLVPLRPSAVITQGENDVFELRTSTGRTLRATARHPVLTPEGWKTVGELGPGTRVAAARTLPVFQPSPAPIPVDRLRLPGHLIGDGNNRRHRGIPSISAGAPAFQDRSAVAEREFGVLARCGQANGTPEAGFAVVSSTGDWAGQSGKTLDRPAAVALAERPGATHAAGMASTDLLWDRVASVTPAGRETVYDLVMPGTHNFLADGLIVHNSGELEQVSDLVIFLYREDYYDLEKAQRENKENICEIIIAKHRNGPIGTVELYFHKEYSRFANLEKRR
jgi:replicative DNA helicase